MGTLRLRGWEFNKVIQILVFKAPRKELTFVKYSAHC